MADAVQNKAGALSYQTLLEILSKLPEEEMWYVLRFLDSNDKKVRKAIHEQQAIVHRLEKQEYRLAEEQMERMERAAKFRKKEYSQAARDREAQVKKLKEQNHRLHRENEGLKNNSVDLEKSMLREQNRLLRHDLNKLHTGSQDVRNYARTLRHSCHKKMEELLPMLRFALLEGSITPELESLYVRVRDDLDELRYLDRQSVEHAAWMFPDFYSI